MQDNVQADALVTTASLLVQAPWMAVQSRAMLVLSGMEGSTLGAMKGSVGRALSQAKEPSRAEGLIQKWSCGDEVLVASVEPSW
jgi:VIT1/CCC1 family predicted Fe2+/Mn2+ transporter